MAEIAVAPRARTGSVDWSAAVWAGVVAGLVFLVLEMLMVPLFLDGSPWAPPRMIAAIVLGKGALPPPATFAPGIVAVAMVVHFALSIVYAVVLAWIVHRMGLGAAIGVGALFGLALYLVNFYGLTAVFPWFGMARNWVSVFAHVVFGVVAAWWYRARARPATERAREGA